jgi:hypothetical protein
MVIRWTLIKVYGSAGPVYGGVVASEPWETEDNVLIFSKVSYLKLCSFPVIWSFEKDVDIKFDDTTSVFGAVDILYSNQTLYPVKLGLNMHGIIVTDEQACEDGSLRPVGYSSKSYNDAKKNYTTYDKEMLAIMRALDEWRSLLIGARQPFEIYTDHCNLTYFRDPQKLTSRQANWMTKLQDFDFIIKHITGMSNVSADALSRPDGEEKAERTTDVLLSDRLFVGFLA